MVLLLLSCIVEMPKEVEREGKGSQKWNTLWKQACTNDEKTLQPCQSQLLPKSTTDEGNKQSQKTPIEATLSLFLCSIFTDSVLQKTNLILSSSLQH